MSAFFKIFVYTLLLVILSLSCFASSIYATEFGFHFASQFGYPSLAEMQLLHPTWVRYGLVVPHSLPTFPPGIKTLLIFNNESTVEKTPLGSTDPTAWKSYIDNGYLPELGAFLKNYHDITAIEIWNEEDICPASSYCPKVPAQSYAYMLKNAARTIKAFNSNIEVISGGTGASNTSYLQQVIAADNTAFSQVDGVGVHPYSMSPNGFCATGCLLNLDRGDMGTFVNNVKNLLNKPIWVTEIGYDPSDAALQGQFAQRTFSLLQNIGNVSMVIWYAMQDGGSGPWGLIDTNGHIKPSGQVFTSFTSAVPTISIAPTGPFNSSVPCAGLSISQSACVPNSTSCSSIPPYIYQQPSNACSGSNHCCITVPNITPTPSSGISVNLFLHGLGTAGDNANQGNGGNAQPVHTSRQAVLTIFDASNTAAASVPGSVVFNSSGGNFLGTFAIPGQLNGTYTFSIKVNGFLQKQFPGFQQVSSQNSFTLPSVYLTTGDINLDNQLDILDYNALVSCFGSKQNTSTCTNPPTQASPGSDITDNGVVDGSDYNLLLREFSVQVGG